MVGVTFDTRVINFHGRQQESGTREPRPRPGKEEEWKEGETLCQSRSRETGVRVRREQTFDWRSFALSLHS